MKQPLSHRHVMAATLGLMGALASAESAAQGVNPAVAPATATVATAAATAAPRETPAATPDRPAAQPEAVTVTEVPVDGILVRRGRSETVINAPMDVVVRAMTDYTRYSEFMPHVRESRVVRRNRSATDVYVQVPLGGSLGVIWALLRIDAHRQADRVDLVGQTVDSNMDRFETRSVIERVPGPETRTRVVFEVLALPRLPFPSSVFTREMRDAARTVANNLRTRVERQLAINTLPTPAGAPAGAQVPPNATSSR
ncbi:MAG: SRPBCC family protein [Polyangiales bacterium]